MPLLSSKLPRYSGPYDVGTIDIEAPCEKRQFGEAIVKETGRPAFELETVLFSLYYPSVKGAIPQAPLHPWVPRPLALHGEGYARFAKVNNRFMNSLFTFGLWALASSTLVPANVDVPLHGSTTEYRDQEKEKSGDASQTKFPVIVFSHGMASCRTSYTQYCGELASRGFIVAAIEHRDGSGPGSVVMSASGSRNVFHISPAILQPEPENSELKMMQLAMRQGEVEETVRILRQINAGHGAEVLRGNPRHEGKDLSAWKDRLNLDRIIVGGHSYGATLALQTLRKGPTQSLPFVGCIALDPGKQSGPLNDDINVPLVIIHSQSWSSKHTIFHGRPHFSVVKDIVRKICHEKKQSAWFTTAKGTTHPSVTDAPLIEPFLLAWTTGATIDAREGVLQYVKVTKDFMDFLATEERRGVLNEPVTHPEFDEDVRSEQHKKETRPDIEQFWQIHVAPGDGEEH